MYTYCIVGMNVIFARVFLLVGTVAQTNHSFARACLREIGAVYEESKRYDRALTASTVALVSTEI